MDPVDAGSAIDAMDHADSDESAVSELSSTKPFANPFLAPFPTNPPAFDVPDTKDIIVTGSHGIGKTLFLYVILALRLCASLPTLLCCNPNEFLFFIETGVFEIRLKKHRDKEAKIFGRLFPNAWCLVDSSSNAMITIPKFILETRLNIIQAASPQENRFDWTRKRDGTLRIMYIMKPWNLSELIMGRQFQTHSKSELALQQWYRRYVPLPRLAYGSLDIMEYDRYLSKNIPKFDISTVPNLRHSSPAMDFSEVVSQFILLSPKSTRSMYTGYIPTGYLCAMFVGDIFGPHRRCIDVYKNIIKYLGMQSIAGYEREVILFGTLPMSGKYEIKPFGGERYPRSIMWKPKPNVKSKWLCVGFPGKEPMTIVDEDPGEEVEVKEAIDHERYDPTTLRDGAYNSAYTSQPTYDAFYYYKKHAILFRFTAAKTHTVSPIGLHFLREKGVERFTYVAITSPEETELTITDVDDEIFERVDGFYQMIFD